MRKLFLGLTIGIAASASSLNAFANSNVNLTSVMTALHFADAMTPADLINWKVGDYQKIKVDFLLGGGEGRKEATKEETAEGAIWLVSEITFLGQKQKTEALIRRSDAKTLKLLVNGKEEDPDQGTVEIIEQDERDVTVGAGKFDCMYVKGKMTSKTGQSTDFEAWVNPIEVNLDGSLKLVIQSPFGPITMSLQEFGPKAL